MHVRKQSERKDVVRVVEACKLQHRGVKQVVDRQMSKK